MANQGTDEAVRKITPTFVEFISDYHPNPTATCPNLPRMMRGIMGAKLTDEEKYHIANCDYCGKFVSAMEQISNIL